MSSGPQPGSTRLGFGSVALVVALCVAVGGLAFAAGRLTAPTASRAAGFGGFGGRGGAGQGPAPSGAPFGVGGGGLRSLVLRGTVTAVAGGRLTIQLDSGATVEIDLGADTTVHRQAPASSNDLTAGSSVLVQLAGGAGAGGQGGAFGGPTGSPGTTGARQLGTAADVTILSP
ncbi:MAG TPA: hypothetical protein VNO86_06895 [Candidatus Binatia bacterium]|nr:hypothetical protein [Candidatus Binatia bacterium]